jgi:anti-sigma B factor antagonist
MEIQIEQKEDISIIKCSGNIDYDVYHILKEKFDKLISDNIYKIVVDLSDVDFISSAGWGVFIGNLQKVKKNNGDIFLSGMKEEVKNIYKSVNLDEILISYDTLEEAIKSFR